MKAAQLDVVERTTELLTRFSLSTAAPELAQRLETTGHRDALLLVLEVLEMEAEAREQRKIARLRRAACAIGHALVEQGHSVLFRPAYQLVQELLAAKRDLLLPQKLRRLDCFELLILDDIGYIKQGAEEAEVLFTLIAERYERGSMLITSNLVFSDWEGIFKEPMATAAAIDRLVHHAVILEFNVPNYRTRKRRRTDTDQSGSATAGGA
jgi:hypothetical protein